jgi:hypothetical protein
MKPFDRPERQAAIDNLPRFCFRPRRFPFHLLLEVLVRHVTGFVQPGCTIEVCCLSHLASFVSSSADKTPGLFLAHLHAQSNFAVPGELAPAEGKVFLVSGTNLERACLRSI